MCSAMAELLVTVLLSSCSSTSARSNPSEHRQLQEEMPPGQLRLALKKLEWIGLGIKEDHLNLYIIYPYLYMYVHIYI